jgi:hypothetical protein
MNETIIFNEYQRTKSQFRTPSECKRCLTAIIAVFQSVMSDRNSNVRICIKCPFIQLNPNSL